MTSTFRKNLKNNPLMLSYKNSISETIGGIEQVYNMYNITDYKIITASDFTEKINLNSFFHTINQNTNFIFPNVSQNRTIFVDILFEEEEIIQDYLYIKEDNKWTPINLTYIGFPVNLDNNFTQEIYKLGRKTEANIHLSYNPTLKRILNARVNKDKTKQIISNFKTIYINNRNNYFITNYQKN